MVINLFKLKWVCFPVRWTPYSINVQLELREIVNIVARPIEITVAHIRVLYPSWKRAFQILEILVFQSLISVFKCTAG